MPMPSACRLGHCGPSPPYLACAYGIPSAGQHADGKLGLLECTCGKVQLAFTNDVNQ